jgi:hypothetical protein
VERELQDTFLYRDDRPLLDYHPNPAELEGLVELSVADAIALFTSKASSAEGAVLGARDRVVQPLTVTPEILLPERYYTRYYLSIAEAIARVIENDPSLT